MSITPPKEKSRKGGPEMLELRNVLNIKEHCEKLRSKKLGKRIFNPPIIPKNWFGKCFWDVLFRTKTSTSSPPSPPVANIFRKIFLRRVLQSGRKGAPIHQPDIPRYVRSFTFEY